LIEFQPNGKLVFFKQRVIDRETPTPTELRIRSVYKQLVLAWVADLQLSNRIIMMMMMMMMMMIRNDGGF
jgi:hypothetical protein